MDMILIYARKSEEYHSIAAYLFRCNEVTFYEEWEQIVSRDEFVLWVSPNRKILGDWATRTGVLICLHAGRAESSC
jgi:hypothetical protein